MKANYNVTGADRKSLVEAIAKLTGEKPRYLGMPTAAYEIGDITVGKDGSVICEDADKMVRIVQSLKEDRFMSEVTEEPASRDEEVSTEKSESVDEEIPAAAEDEPEGLTVSFPESCANIENLEKLLAAKEGLIKKALGINDLRIVTTDNKVSFPWFSKLPEPDEIKAYTHFIAALCKMSKDLKRVSSTEKEIGNEKYAFRCFLLRLGFIGNEYKDERKILLKNLSGNSSWKNGTPKKEAVSCE